MNKKIYPSYSFEETKKIAYNLGRELNSGDVVLLSGNLGAGKTVFTKGLAEFFAIKEDITSPTFTLMNLYKIKDQKSNIKNIVHIDTYRLKDDQELIDIGAMDYIDSPDTIAVIEWPEKIKSLLKNKKTIKVNIESLSENERRVIIEY